MRRNNWRQFGCGARAARAILKQKKEKKNRKKGLPSQPVLQTHTSFLSISIIKGKRNPKTTEVLNFEGTFKCRNILTPKILLQ